jgi:hypothetical protein
LAHKKEKVKAGRLDAAETPSGDRLNGVEYSTDVALAGTAPINKSSFWPVGPFISFSRLWFILNPAWMASAASGLFTLPCLISP